MKRILDPSPEHVLPTMVHYVNPDRPGDYIEVLAEKDGTISVRASMGPLVIRPRVSNHISIGVEKP